MSIFTSWQTSPGARQPLELELPARPEAPSALPAEQAAPYVDLGMPLPESYGIDVVRALVQDPFHLMVYWELRPESLEAIADLFPDGANDHFRPVMRLTDVEDGIESYVAVPLSGKYWFVTTPGRSYRVDVGARSPEHGFVPIVRSNLVATPRGTVASSVDEDPRYRVDTPRFVRLLDVAGFANDRVLSDIALTDAGRPDLMEAQAPPPAHLVRAFGKLPEPVRVAAATVARGESLTEEFINSLPEHVRAILLALLEAGEEDIVRAAFMHLLPQLLRQALDGGMVDEATHPMHVAPRYMLGGSEVLQHPPVDWSWMPSMVESLGHRLPRLEPDALDVVPAL